MGCLLLGNRFWQSVSTQGDARQKEMRVLTNGSVLKSLKVQWKVADSPQAIYLGSCHKTHRHPRLLEDQGTDHSLLEDQGLDHSLFTSVDVLSSTPHKTKKCVEKKARKSRCALSDFAREKMARRFVVFRPTDARVSLVIRTNRHHDPVFLLRLFHSIGTTRPLNRKSTN